VVLLCALSVKSFSCPKVCPPNHTSYNLCVAPIGFRPPYPFFSRLLSCFLFLCCPVRAQLQPAQAVDKQPAPKNPAQIELLETKIRFEANGDSRKEVHARVHINSELGVRQFARLNFDYNRAFENVEIPLVRITHATGGTADILPSAITDNPNPAVVNVPAYQDVRVKSVRILGLQPDDLLEYRVFTTVSHHPLAPDFWLDHSFDRTGVLSQEIFELDFPEYLHVQLEISPRTPPTSSAMTGKGDSERATYRWERSPATNSTEVREGAQDTPDVILSTFASWLQLSSRLGEVLLPSTAPQAEVAKRGAELTDLDESPTAKLERIYDFVSQKISTVDLPLGSTGFQVRTAGEILSTGYATAEEKLVLFVGLCQSINLSGAGVLAGAPEHTETSPPRPSPFTQLLIATGENKRVVLLDPALEVAPFGMIPSNLRGKRVLYLNRPPFPAVKDVLFSTWMPTPQEVPFPSFQRVNISAALTDDCKLTAKVHYSMRGENELLLRVAFHQAPKEKWKDLAQLLSLSDGFRGKVTSVTASDHYATKEPFTVEYELTQPKFVDWSKKPVRIPALLPQLGLPDPPAKPSAGAASSPIELGTPLEVETRATLRLPPGTSAQTPTGTSVQRDYATYTSQYSAKGPAITASRHINFLLREIPSDRAADYNAFLRAVQNDEAQDFTLDRPGLDTGKPAPAKPKP
jgi:hypothetical protein